MQGEETRGVYTICIEFCFVLFDSLCLVYVLSTGIIPFRTWEPLELLEPREYGVSIMGSHSICLPQFSCPFGDLSGTNKNKPADFLDSLP